MAACCKCGKRVKRRKGKLKCPHCGPLEGNRKADDKGDK